MFAYIPARGGSKRIPRKNVKLLGDKELILHVIDNLSKVDGLKGIAVSTDDQEIMEIVSTRTNVTTLGLRDKSTATDQSSFADLIKYDLPRFAKHFNDADILFTTATAALVSPKYYNEAISLFESNPTGLTLSVGSYNVSPYLAMIQQENNTLTPLFPDKYMLPTKDLPKSCFDCGCFYLFNASTFMELNCDKLIDLPHIHPVILPQSVAIDLDTPEDWKQLEKSYESISREESFLS